MNLHAGMHGYAVRKVQEALIALGFTVGKADGQWGPKTTAAVTAWRATQQPDIQFSTGATPALTLDDLHTLGIPAMFPLPEERVARALACVGKNTVYSMKSGMTGGEHPEDDYCSRTQSADCSGALAHFSGTTKSPAPERAFWFETTNLVQDATVDRTFVRDIPAPVRGCLVAYPDHDGHQGHCALVTRFENGVLHGIDCSSSQSDKTGDAIHERDISFFLNAPRHTFMLLVTDPA